MIKKIIKNENFDIRYSIKISVKGIEYLVTGGYDGKVIILNIQNNFSVEKEIQAHSEYISLRGLVYNEEKNYFITGSYDKTIKVWDFESLRNVHTFNEKKEVICLLLIPGNRLVVGLYGLNSKIKIYSLDNFSCLNQLEGHPNSVFDFVLLDNSKFISVGGGGIIKFWNCETGICLKIIKVENENCLDVVSKLSHNEVIVGCRTSNNILKVNINLFKVEKFDLLKDYINHNGIWSFLVLPNGNILCSTDCIVKLINGRTFECLKTLKITQDYEPKDCYFFSIINLRKSLFCSTSKKSIYVYSMKEDNQFKDEFERFQYLVNQIQHNFDLKIDLKNSQPIYGYKSLFGIDNNKATTKTEIFLDKELKNLNNEIVLKILFGIHVDFPHSYLLEYYIFFHCMKLYNCSFLICKEIEKVKDLKILVEIFSICLKQLEINGDDNFRSPFTISVCKRLKENQQNLIMSDDKSLVEFVEDNKLLSKIRFGTQCIIKEHDDYSSIKMEENIERCFIKRLDYMFYNQKHHNFKVISNDGVEYFSDLEILIYFSNFFYKMFSFGGIESSDMKENKFVVVKNLNGKELGFFLDFLFISQVKTDDLFLLLRLLNFSVMYFEYDLKFYLFEKVKRITKRLVEKEELLILLKKIGYLFENEKVLDEFIEYWLLVDKGVDEDDDEGDEKMKTLTKTLILEAIRMSKEGNIMEELRNKCLNYEKRIESLESSRKEQLERRNEDNNIHKVQDEIIQRQEERITKQEEKITKQEERFNNQEKNFKEKFQNFEELLKRKRDDGDKSDQNLKKRKFSKN